MEKKSGQKYTAVSEVTDAERIGIVKDIFSTITKKYDFLNHFLSMRRDIAWRRFTCRKMRFFRTYRLLDVATGTADMAIEAAMLNKGIKVIGLDFVAEMLNLGCRKIRKKNLSERIKLTRGDALSLPFPENSFDTAAVAFGIRNMPDRLRALDEMRRVIVPGGQVMVLEFTSPQNLFLRKVYSAYLNRVLPRLAGLLSQKPEAYFYLAESIMEFPAPEKLARLMEEAGLVNIAMFPLTMGITYLHVGQKPET